MVVSHSCGLLMVVAVLGGAVPAGCSMLLNDGATQCRDDVDCARFSGSVCDRTHGLCVVGPTVDASPSASGGASGRGGASGHPGMDAAVSPVDARADGIVVAQGGAGSPPGDGAVAVDADAAVASVGDCPDLNGNGVADCLETLLVNPGFDRGITGWTSESGMTQSFPSLDANGRLGSGSLAVTNPVRSATAAGLTMGGSAQCLSALGGAGSSTYDLYLQAAVVPVSDSFTEAGALVAFYGTADCSGTANGSTTPKLVDDSVEGWHVLQDIVRPPAGTLSMLMRLVVLKPFNQAASQAMFDNILLRAR